MTYSPYYSSWKDWPDTSTPITAAAMQHIETGIVNAGNGGGGAGSPVVRGPFSFAFDTPNLLTGADFYTPTIGDVMIGCVIRIDEDWNGTDAHGDVGTFTSGATAGLFRFTGVNANAIPMQAQFGFNGAIDVEGPGLGEFGNFFFFTTTDPLKVVVTQNGRVGGDDPGASQGAASIYIVTATPVAFA